MTGSGETPGNPKGGEECPCGEGGGKKKQESFWRPQEARRGEATRPVPCLVQKKSWKRKGRPAWRPDKKKKREIRKPCQGKKKN